MTSTVRTALLFAALAASGCSEISPNAVQGMLPASIPKKDSGKFSLERLYVTGGPQTTRHPDIEVFNGYDSSSDPAPIYTIHARAGGTYGAMVTDDQDDLFVVNYFANGAELDVFPPGDAKPTISCLLHKAPNNTYIQGDILYLATSSYTIQEYSLPLHARHECPKPTKTLTDDRAKLRGGYFPAVAVDRRHDVFDIWQSGMGNLDEHVDLFKRGAGAARRYTDLGRSHSSFVASDARGDLATNAEVNGNGSGGAIGIVRYGSRRLERYDPMPNGAYLGFAFANRDTELFVSKDYPAASVLEYSYNPTTGRLGKFLRSFSTGIWYYASSIAVYSRG